MSIKIHTSSAGLDPAQLQRGRDLVLHVDMAHGFDLADGVGTRDHLDAVERGRIDGLALELLGQWRARWDQALTIDGICWPFVLELELLMGFVPVLADALGLERALLASGQRVAVLGDDDPRTAGLLEVVAERHRIEVRSDPRAMTESEPVRAAKPPLLRRLRHGAFTLLTTKLGAPSWLRDDSIVISSYWPLMPLLDALLAEAGRRPAVILNSLPTGPRRTLRAAAQGGWVGRPGPWGRASATRSAKVALSGAAAETFSTQVRGLALGPLLHRTALEVIRPQLARRVWTAATVRRAFARGRARGVIVPFDDEPGGRLVVILAREAGIPTLLVQHGAYFLPCVVPDLTLADQVAIWSAAVVPQRQPDRRFHPVGYPLGEQPRPQRRARMAGAPPRVVILPQPWHAGTAAIDSRAWMRHCVTAVGAVLSALPEAEVILRPHPSDPANLGHELRRRFAQVQIDSRTEILRLLADSDLCLGASTTATLQAALVNTPVVFLNLTGYEWRWPVGGETPVPIARSGDELRAWIERWRDGVAVPGRDQLLSALGADRPEPTKALLALLDRQLAGPRSSALAGAVLSPQGEADVPSRA